MANEKPVKVSAAVAAAAAAAPPAAPPAGGLSASASAAPRTAEEAARAAATEPSAHPTTEAKEPVSPPAIEQPPAANQFGSLKDRPNRRDHGDDAPRPHLTGMEGRRDVSDDIELLSQEDIEAEHIATVGKTLGEGFKRVPFGGPTQKLFAEKRPGFRRHWFNDVPGRIDEALRAGYTHVKNSDGQNISRVVGTHPHGGALTAFLMETLQRWFEDDMAAGQRELDIIDREIRGGNIGRKEDDKRYVPDGGIRIDVE